MNQNKTGKYFKYAIGEIILVVIGILIALSINNWNEQRKSLEKSKILLTQLHKELAMNIYKANIVIRFYRNKDSIIYKALHKKLTYNDYKTRNNRYIPLLRGSLQVNIINDAFINLIENQNEFNQTQDIILEKLKHLYGTDKREVDAMDEYVMNSLFNRIKLLEKDGWIYDNHISKTASDEQINYYLTSSNYLGEVTEYKIRHLNDHNNLTLKFRNHAIDIYNEISDYLTLEKDTSIVKDINEYQHYLGAYEREEGDFIYEIKKQNNNLIWAWKHKTNSKRSGEINFYPDSKTYFTVSDNRFGKIIYSNNNEVTGFILSLGEKRHEYKKIK